MDLPTPQLIDLTSWGDEASATSREIWEISVPEECSFVWSIILARAASLNADWEMTSKNLLPKDEEKEEFCLKINEIVSFNPFKNRHTLFLDESLTQLIRKIDEKLNIHVKNVMQKDETFTEDSHLKEAASAMLLCRIKVLRTDFQNDKTITRQAKTFLDRQSSDTTIVIFEKYMNSPNEARFSFGMDLRRANSLRKMSLESILREAKLYVKDIGGIIKPVTEQERIFNCNFLLTLIESQPIELIEGLYKSPYIVWKLADAGFNTNPFYTQGGNSAFFYCLGLESSRLLYVLYNYAINNYHRTGKSVRNPNSDVLNALKNVDDKLKDHYKMIIKRQYSELHEHVLERKAWFEIFHFNKYQKTVIKKISAMPDNDLNSNFKMAKIKCVLKKYVKYFYIKKENTKKNSALLKEYLRFNKYHENVDNFTGLLVFDNILCFNRKNSQDFLDILFNLFKCILSYAKFSKCGRCYRCKSKSSSCELMIIPFIYRSKFLRKSEKLLNILKSNTDNVPNNPNQIMRIINEALESYPEIKDDFAIKRLERYLMVAAKEPNGIKKVLATKRAIQVLGETLIVSPGKDLFGKTLLRCTLPAQLVKTICVLRDKCFSHYGSQLWLGIKDDAFLNLQSDFENILKLIRDINSIQAFRIQKFLIKNCNFRYNNKLVSYMNSQKRKNWRYTPRYIVKRQQLKIAVAQIKLFKFVKNRIPFILNNVMSTLSNSIILHKTVKSFNEEASCLKNLYEYLKKRVKEVNLFTLKSFFDFLEANINEEINDSIKDQINNHLSYIKKGINNLFENVAVDNSYEFNYLNFEQLYDKIENHNFFCQGEIDIIKEKCLMLSNSQGEMELVDIINDVKNMMNFTKLCEPKIRNLLLNIDFPDANLKTKIRFFLSRKINFLINRIERLKEILVDENRDIKYLFSSNCNEGEKKHAIFLMCESYKKNHGFRFSAEMLLFDCLNIFEKRKDLDDLKEKLSGLFSGINLRNVLSHGDVLLENMGLYLDKDDLPSNLIEKMLQLIDDLPALKALSDLWWETNSNNCKEFKNELSKIKGTPLSEKIKNCPRWQEYMLLLPLQ